MSRAPGNNERLRRIGITAGATGLLALSLYAAHELGVRNALDSSPRNPGQSLPGDGTSDGESAEDPAWKPARNSRDTSPGLNMYNLDFKLSDAGAIAKFMELMATADTEVQEQNLLYRMFMAEPKYGPVPMDGKMPEEVGLGITPRMLAHFAESQRFMNGRFTSASRNAAESLTEPGYLVFKNDPREADSDENSFSTDTRVDRAISAAVVNQHDNLFAVTYQQAGDILKTITLEDGTPVWDVLTPAQRGQFMAQLTQSWYNQRHEGPITWDAREVETRDGDALMTVQESDDVVICEIQAEPYQDDREDQNLDLRKAMIEAQETETQDQTPKGEWNRFDQMLSVVVIDVETLNDIARNSTSDDAMISQLITAVLNTAGRYEPFNLTIAHNAVSEAQNAENQIPDGWDISGLTRRQLPFETYDFVQGSRPCGLAKPKVIVTVVPEVQPEQPELAAPPQEVTTPPTETPPEDTPPEKEDCHNCNKDGTTEDDMGDPAEDETTPEEANDGPDY